jgi:calcineurin-like phosphoesterase family protein
MIAELLNRDVVLDQLSELKEFVEAEAAGQQPRGAPTEGDPAALLRELENAEQRETSSSSGQPSFDDAPDVRRGLEPPPIDDYVFLSRDPIVSLVQSALDAAYERPENAGEVRETPPDDDRRGDGPPLVAERSLESVPPPKGEDGRRVFEQFSVTDIGWVRSKLAEGIRLFRKRHAFNTNPARPVNFGKNARLVVVGDWGSGLPRAQSVAKEMRKKIEEARTQGRNVHVVHLGDVYYSGWGHEYRKRFLPFWPVKINEAEQIGSWNLNGNHDMYSGGHAYYDVALADPRFARWQSDGHAGSSFFTLINDDWKIIGLDTSWEDGGLQEPQPQWLRDELRDAGRRKTLLLSHHQLFSAYESGASSLIEKVSPVLAECPVTAWFWGHEHRSMTFENNARVGFGCCLGDGGVPVYQWHRAGDAYPAPGRYEHRRFIAKGLEHWAYLGFCVLDFNGPAFDVRYYDETGLEHHKEQVE